MWTSGWRAEEGGGRAERRGTGPAVRFELVSEEGMCGLKSGGRVVGAPGTGPSALGWVWKTSALASGSSEQPRWVHSGGKRKRLEPVQDKPGLWV